MDRGLLALGGLGSGIVEGLKAYQDTRRLNMDEERAKRADKAAQAGLLLQANKEGYAYDPESGLLTESEVGKSTRDLERRFKESQIVENLAQARAAGKKNNDLSRLPVEDQKVVEGLSTDNATKIAIANQIDSVMGGWDKLTDDQKLAQGRQLLKVLNSSQGKDAVGAEEAKRLGSKLEFGMMNIYNNSGGLLQGGINAGRDLPGFAQQARDTSNFLKKSNLANDEEISRRYGRSGIKKAVTRPAGLLEDSGSDDPQISDYAKQHKLSYSQAKTILEGRGYGRKN